MDNKRHCAQKLEGAVILAGGDSKRLGRPKSQLDFQGCSLIELMVERLGKSFRRLTIVTDRPELYRHLPVRLASDLLTGQAKSPLRGIHAGLSMADLPYQFVAACDMPFLSLDLIRYMAGFAQSYDAVVPKVGSYFQPLHAFYNRSCISVIEKQLYRKSYKITDFYANLEIRYIDLEEIVRFDPNQKSFFNINTWDDYKRALEIASGRLETG